MLRQTVMRVPESSLNDDIVNRGCTRSHSFNAARDQSSHDNAENHARDANGEHTAKENITNQTNGHSKRTRSTDGRYSDTDNNSDILESDELTSENNPAMRMEVKRIFEEEINKEKKQKLSDSSTEKFKSVKRDGRSYRSRSEAGICPNKEKRMLSLKQGTSNSQHVTRRNPNDS